MIDCDFILFGASGDLAMRKIFPSLFQIYSSNFLTPSVRIIASARSKLSEIEFKEVLNVKAKIHIKNINEQKWQEFLKKISYISIELNKYEDFLALKQSSRKNANVVIYFSISPEFFIKACKNLALIGFNNQRVKIVLEKPLGMDLHSCKAINTEIAKYYKEKQIYRIDHYLGKESVQNILYLRKYNGLLQNIWNNKHIAYVEISVFETLGVENRGEFYDKTGALRDMLQNHMIQILSLLTLKMPSKLNSTSLRRAKCKLLKELKPFSKQDIKENVIRAQYTQNGKFKGYLDEAHIQPNSKTESYVALKAFIDNKTWQGVPFYLRTGKRMKEQFVQIVLHFKGQENTNKLVINLQPHNFIALNLRLKKEGIATYKEENLFIQNNYGEGRVTQPYESLIKDAINGNLSSFNHQEELESSWLWLDNIIKAFAANELPLYHYAAGSFGPKEAEKLIQKDGNTWLNP
ncbi:glucose-6-phosphate dehydrogenase [Campylobacter sp. MIT 97-5078]|uniref:glucose-6-phosphate dehydrogenase n=1 Tax=Campylobacter sp. MIT 97-5078 TaxID=1548153 RepID=UPI0005139CAF|nr:glucose-6-phosphate dehydrogenase [Campylobacter sp. MIT 97-5078]KGI55556.1 glucose-6-phosphate dehydrogenase [Campylobacter sp. MIT 97-5078]KGI57773.1 glucose-6-phosphate dehydrogenase [Campylobacter sp. MIT 97-5078]TQR23062.1 glucose-6-phosphate dehydrogenase [Campylobacter sp. MIT 97-5078]